MSISGTWTQFRERFAQRGRDVAATFAWVAPDQITRAAGSFVDNGYLATHDLDIIGSVSNDGHKHYNITSLVAGALTVTPNIVAEAGATVDMYSGWYDVDGAPQWPGPMAAELGRTNLVRSGGFAALTGIPLPYNNVNMTITANATAADAVQGTDEYAWYLSQGTDAAADQFWSVTQYTDATTDTFSGTVVLAPTALMTAQFPSVTTETLREVLESCHLYCTRLSDGAIQWADLYREMTSA